MREASTTGAFAEPGPSRATPEQALSQAQERWRAAFATIETEADRMPELLKQAHASAAPLEPHADLRRSLAELAAKGENAAGRIRSLVDYIDRLQDEWSAAHRYTRDGVARLTQQLDSRIVEDGRRGGQAWLHALFDAADAGESAAAAAIATARLRWPEELRAGAERLGKAFADWREGGEPPLTEPIDELARAELDAWHDVLTPELQSRAHRFAAWTALRATGDLDRAGLHLEEAVRHDPYSGRMHAERAAFRLFVGDFESAAADAQHAIEIAPREASGYLALGIWAELTGKFSAADKLYRRGLKRMPTAAVARIHKRSALVDPPGRLLKTAAGVLLDADQPDPALTLAKEALLSGVRGIEAHAEAGAYIICRRALEQLSDHPRAEAAEAAMSAGRLCILNGDVECALEELEHAIKLGGSVETRWLLADALLTKSFPLGAPTPDQDLVKQARQAWESGAKKGNLPRGATSWAYVTRAIVSDLESQRPNADRRAGLFEALLYVEKALVHNHTDAQRWGYVAQFLRYLGLEQLAFEAADAGYRLAPADRQVLAERLPLLANRRDFEEGEAVAERLIAMYGEDPWVSAVRAWLALHHRKDAEQALSLLALPIAQGNDQAWYHEMQALAYLSLGELEHARESYQSVLDAPAIDGNTKCRLARAWLALGNRSEAQRWLAQANNDPTTPRPSFLIAEALSSLAEGQMDVAVRALEEAVGVATNALEVDDIILEMTLAMRAFAPGQEATPEDREHALRKAIEEAVAARKAELERDPPTADSEIEAVLAELADDPLDVRGVALLALGARRDLASGHRDRGLRRYQRLRGTAFEPEAAIIIEQISRPNQSAQA